MKNLLIYLIDDDGDDREIFNIVLKDINSSATCITAENAIEALKTLQTKDEFIPDYIFLDLNMPLMNGRECLMELKQINRLSSVPIIIYTTSSFEKDIIESKKLGASHYLLKPSNIEKFIIALSELFSQTPKHFCLNFE